MAQGVGKALLTPSACRGPEKGDPRGKAERGSALTGRVLTMGASSGPMNRGMDEALAWLCRDHAILRFYTWESPTVSIGYFQRSDEIDLDACRASAVSVVRRPTGGRAVLHHRDLTYSLVLPLKAPWSGLSIAESCRRINSCFRRGLELLGVSAGLEAVSGRIGMAGHMPSPLCFSAVSRHEVVVGGKKVIGSAQRRFPETILQQGSILMDFDPAEIFPLFRRGDRAAMADSLAGIGSLREALGCLPDRAEVEAAVVEGFADEMEVEFAPGTLDCDEIALSGQLAAGRYASHDWTGRR